MHLNHLEAIQVVQKLSYRLSTRDLEAAEVSVHPPFTDLRSVQMVLGSDDVRIALGAQHCHWEDKGAYTGEVSPTMLAKLNVVYVIAGHSERRQLFGETDEMVRRRVHAILRNGMCPIVCMGETLQEREAGTTASKVRHQVASDLVGLSPGTIGGLVIAYEPIWAIGTGHTATAADAQETCATIRSAVGDLAGQDAAGSVRIQYGGSVAVANAAELCAQPDVDGLLVGGASLDPDVFAAVVRAALGR
jgi:triosephosphate isomerase